MREDGSRDGLTRALILLQAARIERHGCRPLEAQQPEIGTIDSHVDDLAAYEVSPAGEREGEQMRAMGSAGRGEAQLSGEGRGEGGLERSGRRRGGMRNGRGGGMVEAWAGERSGRERRRAEEWEARGQGRGGESEGEWEHRGEGSGSEREGRGEGR